MTAMTMSNVPASVKMFETWNNMVMITEMTTAPTTASLLQRAPARRNQPPARAIRPITTMITLIMMFWVLAAEIVSSVSARRPLQDSAWAVPSLLAPAGRTTASPIPPNLVLQSAMALLYAVTALLS